MIPVETISGIESHLGDCLVVFSALPDNSVDACVTDPPYELKFMGKGWDGTGIAFNPEVWRRVFRVLKPGAHLLAFGGTRTYHRMVCAIEDAGFEIRDQIAWVYGSGFPKSLDVSKAIDKAAGAKRERIGTKVELGVIHGQGDANKTMHEGWQRPWRDDPDADAHFVTLPATDAAKQWAGFGTALKPSWEPIVLARKPLIGTVAHNVLAHGTGALNIDGCRVVCDDKTPFPVGAESVDDIITTGLHSKPRGEDTSRNGRWPANIVHDGSEEVLAAFPENAGAFAPVRGDEPSNIVNNVYGARNRPGGTFHNDSGSAARFFYTAKADSDERIGSKHPTVKPLDLMQWLVRLVTPPGGVVLDPFAGTGTTGEAAFREGFRAILIEREAEYHADICRRMKLTQSGPNERMCKIIKARGAIEDDPGPLFSGMK